MTRTDDLELIARARVGDNAALTELLSIHSGLLWKFATKRAENDSDIDDFYQQACLALLEAAKRWNPARISPKTGKPCKFDTFMGKWVDCRLRTFARMYGLIHVPAYLARGSDAFQRARKPVCLTEPVGGHLFRTIGDLLIDYRTPEACDELTGREDESARLSDLAVLERAIDALSARDWRIVHWRLDGCTLQEIGDKIDLTRERVRQILLGLRKKLRLLVTEEMQAGPPPRRKSSGLKEV